MPLRRHSFIIPSDRLNPYNHACRVALAAGTRIGPYEVTAQIGVGGMGEVWRATDTNLGRQVAIKVLPDTFAHDPERLARFDREAKTLAALNHPNIAAIYGLEDSRQTCLVMELVEGGDSGGPHRRGPDSARRSGSDREADRRGAGSSA